MKIQTGHLPAYDAFVMFEVSTGTKAGRPTVLLLLTAGVLAGALCLAWMQVRATRVLGDEVRIEGTPLIVRPPAGWLRGRDHPGVFIKTIESGSRGRKHEVIERSIKFQYRRWRVFQPLRDLLRLSNYLDEKRAYAPEPARIGGLDGVQVRRSRMFRWRGRQEFGESVYRLVSTARGDQISVEYAPLGGLSPGDMELFDAVCRAVVLDDPSVGVRPEEALAHMGVQFPLAENWSILGPDFPEIAGLYVQSNDQQGIPVWGLGVFRTWLAAGRRPDDLLVSIAELTKPAFTAPIEPRQWTRVDGVTIAALERREFERAGGQIASAWVVAKAPAQAVAIFALADPGAALAANQAAAKLAEEIGFVTSYPADGVKAAEAGGQELAALLRASGAVPWWGAAEAISYYFSKDAGEPLLVESQREAIRGDPTRGYQGFDSYIYADPAEGEKHRWTVDGHADAYSYSVEGASVRRRRASTVPSQESREAGRPSIRRARTGASRSEVLEITVGSAFVCPPVEALAQGWVAQQEEGVWLIEVSPVRGSTTSTQLLTPLEPDPDGHHRVLLVEDYWPQGMLMAFDSDLELVSQAVPFGRFDRVTRDQARQLLRAVGR